MTEILGVSSSIARMRIDILGGLYAARAGSQGPATSGVAQACTDNPEAWGKGKQDPRQQDPYRLKHEPCTVLRTQPNLNHGQLAT